VGLWIPCFVLVCFVRVRWISLSPSCTVHHRPTKSMHSAKNTIVSLLTQSHKMKDGIKGEEEEEEGWGAQWQASAIEEAATKKENSQEEEEEERERRKFE
jgi:hypothetical protein